LVTSTIIVSRLITEPLSLLIVGMYPKEGGGIKS